MRVGQSCIIIFTYLSTVVLHPALHMLTIDEFNGSRPSQQLSFRDGSYTAASLSTASSTIRASIGAALLPEGYPASVSPDYLSFQLWDTIQASSSYVRGMLSSQAIFKGVGVGSQVRHLCPPPGTWQPAGARSPCPQPYPHPQSSCSLP
jgi:hypothetical protein